MKHNVIGITEFLAGYLGKSKGIQFALYYMFSIRNYEPVMSITEINPVVIMNSNRKN